MESKRCVHWPVGGDGGNCTDPGPGSNFLEPTTDSLISF
jgi:hypothetical protein